jgi:glycosyl transferase family 9 (putative heptosyltransferase)
MPPDDVADLLVADLLVIDLLGGIGDLVMLLPSLRGLARTHPGAAVRVLTHAPGATLLDPDPDVAEVRAVRKGGERAAVVAELERRPPDLVVSTTRYDGIAEEIERRVPRSVTDLWRRPPPDEPVAHRYHRILAAEGLVRGRYAPPRIHLTAEERSAGRRLLTGLVRAGGDVGASTSDGARPRSGLRAPAPVVLVPDAGMAVKRWPHQDRLVAELTRRAVPVLVLGRDVPPLDLRALAALFAAVGRRGGVVVGADTGPVRVAAAAGVRTVGLFGPTVAARYGLDPPSVDLQGLPGCPHRRPTAITEQVCWWDAACPLAADGPACMADLAPEAVLAAVLAALGGPT